MSNLYSMAMNISIELITGIGLGVFLGLFIDNYLQTKTNNVYNLFYCRNNCRLL